MEFCQSGNVGTLWKLIGCIFNYLCSISFLHFFSSVQAQYWHDPVEEDEYKEHNIFIADLNQENVNLHQNKYQAVKNFTSAIR